MDASNNSNSVIPAQAGIQRFYLICLLALFPVLRGSFFIGLDSRLLNYLAIRLSWQKTPAKSLVMRVNDDFLEVS